MGPVAPSTYAPRMPTGTLTSNKPAALALLRRKRVPAALAVALSAIGLAGGFAVARAFPDDPHSATSEVVDGTVTWSNEEARLIAFEADGVVRDPLDGDTIYSVIADNWQDVNGTLHSDGGYPTCLAGEKDSPVSMDRHRVELKVLHWDTAGKAGRPSRTYAQHIAVHVRCFD
jgi:hypothetical protein